MDTRRGDARPRLPLGLSRASPDEDPDLVARLQPLRRHVVQSPRERRLLGGGKPVLEDGNVEFLFRKMRLEQGIQPEEDAAQAQRRGPVRVGLRVFGELADRSDKPADLDVLLGIRTVGWPAASRSSVG